MTITTAPHPHDRNAVYCLSCDRDLSDVPRNDRTRYWDCPSCLGKGMSTQYAAAHFLGPYAPPRREPPDAGLCIPGFVRIGPTTYKRISESPQVPAQWVTRRSYEPLPWRLFAVMAFVLLLAMVCR